MIKSIRITNFQSHEDTVLELSPGVNVIVGPSDSGKTAIIRALRWLATNRPGGEAFRRHNTRQTQVQAHFAPGADGVVRWAARERTATLNVYRMYGLDDPLEGFGQSVPQEISDLILMPDICWQGQLDPPFMLSANSGDVARKLNEVADLSAIDTATTQAASSVRAAQRQFNNEEASVAELMQKLEDLSWVASAQRLMARVDGFAATASDTEQEATALEGVLLTAQRAAARLEACPPAEALQGLENAVVAVEGARAGVRALQGVLDACTVAQTKVDEMPDFTGAAELVLAAQVARVECDDAQAKHRALTNAIGALTSKGHAIERLLTKEQQLETQLENEWPNECPLCGQPIE